MHKSCLDHIFFAYWPLIQYHKLPLGATLSRKELRNLQQLNWLFVFTKQTKGIINSAFMTHCEITTVCNRNALLTLRNLWLKMHKGEGQMYSIFELSFVLSCPRLE